MALMHGASVRDDSVSKPPVLLAAGSLTEVMNKLMAAYVAQGGIGFVLRYGPSGRLREEIEVGKRVDVFASASIRHISALAEKNLLDAAQVFARNDLCVVARPGLELTEAKLLEVLSRPDVRMATSTPVNDPMGDYTWQFFSNAERKMPGLYKIFSDKAIKLSGAAVPTSSAKLPYVTAFEANMADVYIMYCTTALSVQKTLPQVSVVRIPLDLNVRNDYGIAAQPESVPGRRFIEFVLSSAGQKILTAHGFR